MSVSLRPSSFQNSGGDHGDLCLSGPLLRDSNGIPCVIRNERLHASWQSRLEDNWDQRYFCLHFKWIGIRIGWHGGLNDMDNLLGAWPLAGITAQASTNHVTHNLRTFLGDLQTQQKHLSHTSHFQVGCVLHSALGCRYLFISMTVSSLSLDLRKPIIWTELNEHITWYYLQCHLQDANWQLSHASIVTVTLCVLYSLILVCVNNLTGTHWCIHFDGSFCTDPL